MRKGRRIFFLTPRLCSIEEYSVRTEKKTPQHKSTYTINTTLQQGETYPALASSHPVRRHLLRRWSQTRLTKPGGTKPEALGRGRGIMSVIGEGARESHCSALPREEIELLCLWGEELHTFTAILSVHFVHSGLRKHQFSLAKP